jgi:chromosome segregation ATPase
VAEIAATVSQTQGRVEDISLRQAQTKQELDESKKKMKELEEMVKKLSAESGDKDTLKTKYQKRMKELEEEIATLKQTIRESDRAHAVEVESLKGKVESLKEKRDASAEVHARTHTQHCTSGKAKQVTDVVASVSSSNSRCKSRSERPRTRPARRSRR